MHKRELTKNNWITGLYKQGMQHFSYIHYYHHSWLNEVAENVVVIHIVCVSVCEQSSCVKCANTSERSVIALLERCQSNDPMGPSTLSNTICMLCSTLFLQHCSRVGSRSHPCPSNPGQGNQNWTLQAHLGHNCALSNNLMHLMHKLRGVCLCARLWASVMRSQRRSAVNPSC